MDKNAMCGIFTTVRGSNGTLNPGRFEEFLTAGWCRFQSDWLISI
jgi:hypothetical protein